MCLSSDESTKLRALADRHRARIVTIVDLIARLSKAGGEQSVIADLYEEANVRHAAALALDKLAATVDDVVTAVRSASKLGG